SDGDGKASVTLPSSSDQHPAKGVQPKPSQGAHDDHADHACRENGQADPKSGVTAGEHQVPSQMQEGAYQRQDRDDAES
ncbi:MAG TPA: hypothetical protein VM915_10660, partial [Verrucomicrobiae bacterium]|nr:hypothetical protein [Verrucomicrobiae bacterium]